MHINRRNLNGGGEAVVQCALQFVGNGLGVDGGNSPTTGFKL